MIRRLLLPALAVLAFPAVARADGDHASLTFDTTLLRSRVTVAPVAPAARDGAAFTFAVSGTALRGGLTLRSGARRVRVAGLRLVPRGAGAWSVRGRVGGKPATTLMTIVPPGQLRLTATGARLLTRVLRPKRALRVGPIGTATVDVVAADARAIVGGSVTWGYNSALRDVFQSAFTPLTSGGVTQGADGLFVLPVTGGSWDPATGTATITTAGAFRIGYQIAPTDATAHGIWVRLAGTRIDLTATGGTVAADSDSGYHDTPPVPPAPRTIATLSPGAPVTDGATLTWTAIPAQIASGGAELVQFFKDAPGRPSLGDVREIDPLTISVQLGG